MPALLLKSYLENDLDTFRQLLDTSVNSRSSQYLGSRPTPVDASSSDTGPPNQQSIKGKARRPAKSTLSASIDRANVQFELNWKDSNGLTILHKTASSTAHDADAYVVALLAHPLINIYIQDAENGWTALHRAFYFGNITVARAILEKESQLLLDQTSASPHPNQVDLKRVKDRDGFGPYDLFAATVFDRHFASSYPGLQRIPDSPTDEVTAEELTRVPFDKEYIVQPLVSLDGHELFAFGDNKNFALGLKRDKNHQYPELVSLKRPEALVRHYLDAKIRCRVEQVARLNAEYAQQVKFNFYQASPVISAQLASPRVEIQDVQMAKFHTVVLTTDPVGNLFVCGYGLDGRLGTGDDRTHFDFVCIEKLGGNARYVVAAAPGQDHTLCVTSRGEVFSWGSNLYGRLGYAPPRSSARPDDYIQRLPKQIFGTLKSKTIVGVAASRIHSVAFTQDALFVFGKNEGQLGLTDSHAHEVKEQVTPKQVAASRFSCGIKSVSAIDRATICLLESNDIHVFVNYGIVRVQIPSPTFPHYCMNRGSRPDRYDDSPERIVKVTGGGDTICALTQAGEVFTFLLQYRVSVRASTAASTTNPNKIRASLSPGYRAWSLKKDNMAARDVAVDQDGAIILCTESGGVWRRVRRPKPKTHDAGRSTVQNFKFLRVPNLTRAVAVRASAFGGFMAIRRECEVTRNEIRHPKQHLWNDLHAISPLKGIVSVSGEEHDKKLGYIESLDTYMVHNARQLPENLIDGEMISELEKQPTSGQNVFLTTSTSHVRLPAHSFLLAARSRVLRVALGECRRSGAYADENLRMAKESDSKILITFQGFDILTLLELVHYVYSDRIFAFWRVNPRSNLVAHRCRQIRAEMIKLGSRIELVHFECAARRMSSGSEPALPIDLEYALTKTDFFDDADARVRLADGEVLIHSNIVSSRCPFFYGLFQGHSQGGWIAQRISERRQDADFIEVDLSHMSSHAFKLVLRHIYADTGEQLFDYVAAETLDDFLDLVLEVLSIADELMLNNLVQVCQWVLSQKVNNRNVCQLLNAVAPCSVTAFKDACLRYLCFDLEAVMANHIIDELDEDLSHELDQVVRNIQSKCLPVGRTDAAETMLLENHPGLKARIAQDRRAMIEQMSVKQHESNRSIRRPQGVYESDQRLASDSGSTRESLQASSAMTPWIQALAVEELFTSPRELLSGPTDELLRESTPPTPVPADQNMEKSSTSPWGSQSQQPKAHLVDIMDQDSTVRGSSLSLGLQFPIAREQRATGSSSFGMSQKERKKQKGRSNEQQTASPSISETVEKAGPSNPWKNVSRSHISQQAAPTPAETSSTSRPAEDSHRSVATPQLTMRQTIANSSSSKPKDIPQSNQSTPQRSVSTRQVSAGAGSSSPIARSTERAPMPIQSIRHQASPTTTASPTQHMHQSLADIISSEEAGKTALKDAVAKRSLQEIQQEQEFQEWWDKESQAVQKAEQASIPKERSSHRGRGRRRGRGKGRALATEQ